MWSFVTGIRSKNWFQQVRTGYLSGWVGNDGKNVAVIKDETFYNTIIVTINAMQLIKLEESLI